MNDDSAVRARALSPTTSFAVRAPAGSGKTSLLIQRILCLLLTVEHPEQIVAITFTRKAAEEMRSRIIEALRLGSGPQPEDPYLQHTWTLAAAALAHDQTRGWQLVDNPGRLRIMTIDSLCQSIVRQMPVTAGMGGMPAVEEDTRQLYREAAREAVASIGENTALRGDIARALRHLDNDWRKLEQLLADMLGRRDQWLPLIGAGSDREVLENAYDRYVTDQLFDLRTRLQPACAAALVELAVYAGSKLEDSALSRLTTLPPAGADALAVWRAIAVMFLTRQGKWRRKVDKNTGFPAANAAEKAMKVRWAELVDTLREIDGLEPALARVQQLPLVPFDDAEWTTVSAIVTLLRTATAHLMVTSGQSGRTDFTAFSLAALVALGEAEAPTDLALSLDYQLRHLLIDEFQDTSVTQYELVRRLTAGWSEDDGRTLFLVGDPMQSIYRFRQADVTLFSRILSAGRLGSVALEALTLSANFRSQARLVAWVNQVMPAAVERSGGDLWHFVAQQARHAAGPEPVVVHPFAALDTAAEARAVCETVQALRTAEPASSIAILVRSRTHLGQVTAALLDAGFAVAAREIKPFVALPMVQDLIALARALLHEADRVAWFAVLRAPWCGLSLASLQRLAATPTTPYAALEAGLATVDADEAQRLERAVTVLATARAAQCVECFSDVLESCWVALGGPALHQGAQAVDDARTFFAVVRALEAEGVSLSAERIAVRLADRYSEPPAAAAGAVQIMTIHRAKGLEFDYVIIPGLGRSSRSGQRELLLLREQVDRTDETNLLLAPIPGKGQGQLYDYLWAADKAETEAETARLLYVALTRARRQVHLIGHAEADAGGDATPARGALLNLLWPHLDAHFVQSTPATEPASVEAASLPRLKVARYASLPIAATPPDQSVTDNLAPEFEWAGIAARHVGTVVHSLLQEFARAASSLNNDTERTAWQQRALRFGHGQLRALGLTDPTLEQAQATLSQALVTTMSSARGRWLFAPAHRDARAEICLATRHGRLVLDRTFVDPEERRWIVDFKTGMHHGGGLEAYLDAEVGRYRPQLERYAEAMSALDGRPIWLGLYFPLLDAWREWRWEAARRPA